MSLTSATNVASSALLSRQSQMEVITSNVANSDNKNYHLRKATLQSINIGTLGTGVYVSSVTRSYDAALEESLRDSTSSYNYQSSYNSKISDIETVLGPNAKNPLNESVVEFADALQNLTTSSDSSTARSALINSANNLSSTLNSSYSSLASLRDTIANNDVNGNGLLSTEIDELNNLVENLITLNETIFTLENGNFSKQQALDLRDERDAIVKDISKYVDINVNEEPNTQYTVELNLASGTVTLVDGTVFPSLGANSLELVMDDTDGDGIYSTLIHFNDAVAGTSTQIDLADESGSIQALVDSRDYMCEVMEDLYNYTVSFANAINTAQAAGFDLNDDVGAALFSVPAAQPASGNIMGVIISDPNKIAAASVTGQSGNGTNALNMWKDINGNVIYNGKSLLLYSDQILSDVSLEVSNSARLAETAETVKTMYEKAVSAVSGISMDEEMVNMLEVQRAYQAASKMVTVIDEMIESVIQMA
ncbi:MAG: flagellar hook-associated protein FlgK [Victivallales bacterium]|nr:flagellar hook-associated protein FlgK [Victivallales bacterium]